MNLSEVFRASGEVTEKILSENFPLEVDNAAVETPETSSNMFAHLYAQNRKLFTDLGIKQNRRHSESL